ncbi:MAG: hypothetical protein KKD73_00965 [Proteobacteria bacterium]|nr:hypothetical protein [Pseudomonadota bacterium]
MAYQITSVIVKDEFKICPLCGYEDGFHTMFTRVNAILKWLFICPSCHAVFDIGHTVNDPRGEK